jgi:hypothetical protein
MRLHGGNSRYIGTNRNPSDNKHIDRQNSFSRYSRKNHSRSAYFQNFTNDRHSSFSDNDKGYYRDSHNSSSARSSFHDRSRSHKIVDSTEMVIFRLSVDTGMCVDGVHVIIQIIIFLDKE